MRYHFKQPASHYLFLLAVFLFCLVFFFKIHPLVPFDTDDWGYLSHTRLSIPLWGSWNPTRVFPELLLPSCASFATWAIAPFTGDWTSGFVLMNAIVASSAIMLYVYMFKTLLTKFANCGEFISNSISTAFLLLHFLILSGRSSDNLYMFWSWDMTAFYYYVISNLLCASLVMYLMRIGSLSSWFKSSNKNLFKKSAVVLGLYFGLFSNLFASIILAAYCFEVLIVSANSHRKAEINEDFSAFLRKNILEIIILLIWFIVQLFEANGSRAASLDNEPSYLISLTATLKTLISIQLNPVYSILLILPYACFVVSLLRKKEEPYLACAPLRKFACAIICLVYLVLICAKSGADYIARPDTFFCVFFFGAIGSLLLMARFLQIHRSLTCVILLVLVIFASNTLAIVPTLRESNISNVSGQISIAVTRDIEKQISSQFATGERNITLYVPSSDRDDNWPFGLYAGSSFERTSKQLGLVDQPISVTLVPDEAMNEKYGL